MRECSRYCGNGSNTPWQSGNLIDPTNNEAANQIALHSPHSMRLPCIRTIIRTDIHIFRAVTTDHFGADRSKSSTFVRNCVNWHAFNGHLQLLTCANLTGLKQHCIGAGQISPTGYPQPSTDRLQALLHR